MGQCLSCNCSKKKRLTILVVENSYSCKGSIYKNLAGKGFDTEEHEFKSHVISKANYEVELIYVKSEEITKNIIDIEKKNVNGIVYVFEPTNDLASCSDEDKMVELQKERDIISDATVVNIDVVKLVFLVNNSSKERSDFLKVLNSATCKVVDISAGDETAQNLEMKWLYETISSTSSK